MWYNLSCLLQTYCHLITSEELSVGWQFSKICGLISRGSGWKKDVVNHLLPVLKGNWSEPIDSNGICFLKQFFTQFLATNCEIDM